MGATTNAKFRYTRVLGNKWFLKLVDDLVTEIWDGDVLIATEIHELIPARGDGSEFDRPWHLVCEIRFPDGRRLTRQSNRWTWWLADSSHPKGGQHLREVHIDLEEYEDLTGAWYHIVGL